ncbi:two-component system response regulator [Aliidiomarina iranensis]|uniref:Two-component system response regulator n=1 Tax=Aliidiomarina iranensis TaxID=1434071 RepID=A0A432VSX8_9GAMM|nr:response regulator [Aliidiomarina iranensis]RUO19342.1 two-component system response regulator [Aliidiomarina iranensis]
MAFSLLLVEDNERTRENILDVLAKTPFQITTAVDGLDGLNLAKLGCFDMVLIDHKMPLMDGMLLLKNLREEAKYANVPLLLMTTSDPEQIAEKAKRLGADLVLGKPLDMDLLLLKIRQYTQESVVA